MTIMLLAHEGIKRMMLQYADTLVQEGISPTRKEAFDSIASSLSDDMFLHLLKQRITESNLAKTKNE